MHRGLDLRIGRQGKVVEREQVALAGQRRHARADARQGRAVDATGLYGGHIGDEGRDRGMRMHHANPDPAR
jgi:hypothetical protein